VSRSSPAGGQVLCNNPRPANALKACGRASADLTSACCMRATRTARSYLQCHRVPRSLLALRRGEGGECTDLSRNKSDLYVSVYGQTRATQPVRPPSNRTCHPRAEVRFEWLRVLLRLDSARLQVGMSCALLAFQPAVTSKQRRVAARRNPGCLSTTTAQACIRAASATNVTGRRPPRTTWVTAGFRAGGRHLNSRRESARVRLGARGTPSSALHGCRARCPRSERPAPPPLTKDRSTN
jgi:hypothetical protein